MDQTIIVAILVLGAASYLGYSAFSTISGAVSGRPGASSCGRCGGCSRSSSKKNDVSVVGISTKRADSRTVT